ncbi:winged helix-turn-helix transcriptional regulator [Candidatus Woesearchaeota archaeon]|nr:MAG: winged helix-turn-helix transcriptional regulator [Candidatus Woesearchaeota archaeon]
MWKKLIVMLILLIPLVSAANLHGNVYNFDLELSKNVKITIDTQPEQVIISKDGSYMFNVPKGDYQLYAESYEDGEIVATAKENISVIDDGEYRFDIVLFPYLEDESNLLNENFEIDPKEFQTNESVWWYVFTILISILVIFLGLVAVKKTRLSNKDKLEIAVDSIENQFEDDLEKVIKILEENNGRITQKELRKKLGLSEAKVSLMITELQHKNVVTKIKKGRANIIIMNKN